MTDLSIILSKTFTENSDGTARLQVWVSSRGDDIPAEIFLMHRLPALPAEYSLADRFIGVCSYADLVNYRTVVDDNRRFYRSSGVDMTFSCRAAALTWLQQLCLDIAAMQQDIIDVGTGVAATATIAADGYTLGFSAYSAASGHSIGLNVVVTNASADPAVFVTRKSATAAETSAYQNTELVSLASPYDMLTYGVTPTTSTYFRKSEMFFVFNDTDKFTAATASLAADFTAAVGAIAADYSALTASASMPASSPTTFAVVRSD